MIPNAIANRLQRPVGFNPALPPQPGAPMPVQGAPMPQQPMLPPQAMPQGLPPQAQVPMQPQAPMQAQPIMPAQPAMPVQPMPPQAQGMPQGQLMGQPNQNALAQRLEQMRQMQARNGMMQQ